MNDDTHPLLGTQRTVRAIRKAASDVARSEIASSKKLATVTVASPLTVTVDGTSVAVAANHLNSYTPTAGDRVLCETFGRQIIVFGTFT
jgi:hypothetical protein